ncbi:MAG: MBL fold metallo-hydrolase [Candidatus Harrisonbacteria bacterium]|nr:MBL fold metallo-hydrolase [Candidatus Harrisonbacteria bacterium]
MRIFLKYSINKILSALRKLLANKPIVALLLLAAADAALWFFIVAGNATIPTTQYYFLNVGQGDSELILFPRAGGGTVKLLIDGGPDAKLSDELGKALPANDRVIDLVLMTHPQLDHFGGFIEVLKNYRVGAFLGTGRKGTTGAYDELMRVIRERNIPYVTLARGSRITYGDTVIDVLSPSERNLASKELNDGCLVLRVQSDNVRALLTCDADANVERELAARDDVRADILKVGHHGSRFSSDALFLSKVQPKVAVIEVGKNSYGHPTKDALTRLATAGAQIFRTDKNGMVKIISDGGMLRVFTERE